MRIMNLNIKINTYYSIKYQYLNALNDYDSCIKKHTLTVHTSPKWLFDLQKLITIVLYKCTLSLSFPKH